MLAADVAQGGARERLVGLVAVEFAPGLHPFLETRALTGLESAVLGKIQLIIFVVGIPSATRHRAPCLRHEERNDLAQRLADDEEHEGEPQQHQHGDGQTRSEQGGERSSDEEAEHASRLLHRFEAVRGRRPIVGDVDDSGDSEREQHGTKDDAVVRVSLPRSAEQPDRHRDQQDGQRHGKHSKCARGEPVQEVTKRVIELEPLARRHENRDDDEDQSDPVSAHLVGNIARALTHASHSPADQPSGA